MINYKISKMKILYLISSWFGKKRGILRQFYTFTGYGQGGIFNHNLDFFGYSNSASKKKSAGTKSIKSGKSNYSTHSKKSKQVKTSSVSEKK